MQGFRDICLENQNRTFIVEPFSKRSMTYRQLYQASGVLAKLLLKKGAKKGDRAIVSYANQIEAVIAQFALLRIGITSVPVNPQMKQNQLVHILNQVKPVAVITQEETELCSIVEAEKVLMYSYDIDDSMEEVGFDEEAILEDDFPLVILYTSGTTGMPKGVVHTYKGIYKDFMEYGRCYEFDQDTRFIQSMPIYHGDGWCHSNLCPFWHGASVILLPIFNTRVIAQFDSYVEEYKGNVLVAVPIMLSQILGMKIRFRYDIKGKIRLALCGSAKLHADTLHNFETEFEAKVYENYSLTETMLISQYSKDVEYKKDSVGKILDECQVKILEDGEILIKSPYLFAGYYQEPELTNDSMQDGWFCTGDTGYVDDENYLYLIGRKKNIINKAGLKIDPEEINGVILKCKGVEDAATIGVEDVAVGEEIYSFVSGTQLKDEDIQLIMDKLKQEVVLAKIPKQVILIDAIPRNAIGKVVNDELTKFIHVKRG